MQKKNRNKHNAGFTLIELLLVISIIGLLSSIVLASVTKARAKARDMVRVSDLKQLQIALEMYRLDNGGYPVTYVDVSGKGKFWSAMSDCSDDGSEKTNSGNTGYIRNLAPKYIPVLPEDPAKSATVPRCYAYASNGTDYMVTALNSEGYVAPSNLRRLSGSSKNIAIFSPGADTW